MTRIRQKTLRMVELYLKEEGPSTTSQVAEAFGWRWRTAYTYLRKSDRIWRSGIDVLGRNIWSLREDRHE